MQKLDDLMLEQRLLVSALKATSRRMQQTARENPLTKGPVVQNILLLRMAEGLIDAHRAAKIDCDGLTLDLIEDAMRHVGERLASESGHARSFSRKRLGPV